MPLCETLSLVTCWECWVARIWITAWYCMNNFRLQFHGDFVCVFCTLLLICSFHWLQSVCLSCNYTMMMMMMVLWVVLFMYVYTENHNTHTYMGQRVKKNLKQSPINCTHHFCTINVIITVLCMSHVILCVSWLAV